jgi:hypothetical protein
MLDMELFSFLLPASWQQLAQSISAAQLCDGQVGL